MSDERTLEDAMNEPTGRDREAIVWSHAYAAGILDELTVQQAGADAHSAVRQYRCFLYHDEQERLEHGRLKEEREQAGARE